MSINPWDNNQRMIQGFGFVANQENWDNYQTWLQIDQTPQSPLSNVKSGGGTYYLIPKPAFQRLKKLRDRFISAKTHKRLHPII